MSHISLLFFKDVTTSRSTLSQSSSSRGLGRVAQERRAPLAATRQHYNSKTCRNNSLCRIRFDVGFEIIEAKRMGTLLRTHHDTLPGKVLNMSTHRRRNATAAKMTHLSSVDETMVTWGGETLSVDETMVTWSVLVEVRGGGGEKNS